MQSEGFEQFSRSDMRNVDDFQNRILIRKTKGSQIDQITNYNKRESRIIKKDDANYDFDEKAWGAQKKQQIDFFEEEGKNLVGQGDSNKNLDKKFLVQGLLLNLVLFGIKFYSYSPWWIATNISMLIANCFIILKQKQTSKEKSYKYQIIYHYLIRFSILLGLSFIVYNITQIFFIKLIQKTISILAILFSIILIYVQTKIFNQNIKILWMQRQLLKKDPASIKDDLNFNDNQTLN